MESSDSKKNDSASAIDVFAEFLEREDLSASSFSSLCDKHPDLSEDLRRLRSNLLHVEGFLARSPEPAQPIASSEQAACEHPMPVSPTSVSEAKTELLDQFTAYTNYADRYKKGNVVGRGGMGAVLQTWDRQLHRQIAMKVLLGSEGSDSNESNLEPRHIRRFLEEVQITAQLDHPGVVPVHELGLDGEGRLYFTMRLVHGRDLRTIFKMVQNAEEGWNLSRALSSFQRVCETMAFAHERGVVHRDLKPANIMVGRHGETYVMDWGLAKTTDARKDGSRLSTGRTKVGASRSETHESVDSYSADRDGLLTNEGTVIGTPTYMPPEQARGDLLSIGPRSDVYSIGAMLYHLLAGHPPFLGKGQSASASLILDQLLLGPPESLDRIQANIPAELTAICERAMSREPEDRYADIGDMAEDLRAYQEGRVVRAYETGAVAEFRKWVRRNRGMAASIAAGTVLAIGGLISTSVVQARANRLLADKNSELDSARATAVAEAQRAQANEEIARAEQQKVLRLADQDRLDDLRESASALYPARPDKIEAMEAWQETAQKLVDRLPQYRIDLEQLRQGAKARSPKDQAENSPNRAETERTLARLAEARDLLATKQEQGSLDVDESQTRSTIETLEHQLAQLTRQSLSWRSWIFESREKEWYYNQLLALTEGIEEFDLPRTGLRERIRERYEFALQVGERTVQSPRAAASWSEAIASIQNQAECPLYEGLSINPQIGLVPLGLSDLSGLWEFALIETGEVPQLRMDGSFAINADSALVFVLVPGGQTKLGSIRPSPQNPLGSPYVDPQSEPDEYPLSTIELDPFFISKYELTQGQWLRMTGATPSFYAPGGVNDWGEEYELNHPLESITYEEARTTLSMFGMTLPTEAQWEYCARAGTTTAYWTGNDKFALKGLCNLADQSWAQAVGDALRNPNESWSDGWVGTAPVGSFPPNPFGLYDTLGNVWEMCLDESGAYTRDRWSGTGEIASGSQYYRIVRGGSISNSAHFLRSAQRFRFIGESRAMDIGVRPAVRLR